MDSLNLPKTKNRILTENYLSEIDELLKQIVELKENIPKEIANESIDIFKQNIIDIKGELISMSSSHKQDLENLSVQTKKSITDKVNQSFDEYSTLVINSINNNLLYLTIFGVFCGFIGGLVVYLAELFIS